MNGPERQSSAESATPIVPPGSKLGRALRGLDPEFALNELTARQRQGVHDKQRQRRMIEALYGLYGDEPMSLKQTGQKFGVSREKVRQNEVQALKILYHLREEYKPEAFLPFTEAPDIYYAHTYPYQPERASSQPTE